MENIKKSTGNARMGLSPYVMDWNDSPSLLYMLEPLLPANESAKGDGYIIVGMGKNAFSAALDAAREAAYKAAKNPNPAAEGMRERNRKALEAIKAGADSPSTVGFIFQTAYAPTGETTPRAGLWPYSERNLLTTRELEAYYRALRLGEYGGLDAAAGAFSDAGEVGFVHVAPQLYPFMMGVSVGENGFLAGITDMVDGELCKTYARHGRQPVVDGIEPAETINPMFSEGAFDWDVYRGRVKPTSAEKGRVLPHIHFNESLLATACLPLLEASEPAHGKGILVLSKKEGYAWRAVERACKKGGYRFRGGFPLMEGFPKGSREGEAFATGMGRLEGYLQHLLCD